MEVFPAAILAFAVWVAKAYRDADLAVVVTIATLPFGMFAAARVAGLSLLVTDLLAAGTVALLVSLWMRRHDVRLGPAFRAPATLFLIFFAVYAAFSAIILVRFFEGRFLVFPMNVSSTGMVVSIYFQSTMSPVRPSMSNLAQTGYIVLACAFFIAALGVFLRRSALLGERGLAAAAGLNIALGFLDMLSLDSLLSVIRTADYTLLNLHEFNGFPRVIGGFSEAAGFGAASATFFAYFTMAFLMQRRRLHAVLGLGNLIFALLSLSSSGFIAVAMAVIVILIHIPVYLGRGMSRTFAHWFVIIVSLFLAAGCLLLLMPGVVASVESVLDWLIFSKAGSESGIERSAWARAGLQAFSETWGLGAGAGSLRANGMVSVLLGSVGLPGALAFAGFLVVSISGGRRIKAADERRMFFAARVTALTLLAALLVSATSPTPTYFLIVVAAMATSARLRSAMARSGALPAANGVPA